MNTIFTTDEAYKKHNFLKSVRAIKTYWWVGVLSIIFFLCISYIYIPDKSQFIELIPFILMVALGTIVSSFLYVSILGFALINDSVELTAEGIYIKHRLYPGSFYPYSRLKDVYYLQDSTDKDLKICKLLLTLEIKKPFGFGYYLFLPFNQEYIIGINEEDGEKLQDLIKENISRKK